MKKGVWALQVLILVICIVFFGVAVMRQNWLACSRWLFAWNYAYLWSRAEDRCEDLIEKTNNVININERLRRGQL